MVHLPSAVGAKSILKAATALFAAEGFEGASVAEIASKAGVCKANVFHHYPSKEELYVAVIKQATDAHADFAENLFREPGRSASKVRRLVEFELHQMLADGPRARLLWRGLSESGHLARSQTIARTVFQRNFTAVVNIFEQGRQSGEFQASLDCAAAAMLLCGAVHCFFVCQGALREFRETRGVEAPEEYVGRIAALILSGVACGCDAMPPPVPQLAGAES